VNLDATAVAISRSESDYALTLRGIFQFELARRLHECALEIAAAPQNVAVDCSRLEHLDARTVPVLLALKETLERSGAPLRLSNLPQEAQNYLTWGGLAGRVGTADGGGSGRKRKKTKRTL